MSPFFDATVEMRGVELDVRVEYDYERAEPATRDSPGCDDEAEILAVTPYDRPGMTRISLAELGTVTLARLRFDALEHARAQLARREEVEWEDHMDAVRELNRGRV